MRLPFTPEEFMQIFRDYNTAVFPMQIIFYLLAITVLYYLVRKNQQSDKAISIILSFFWLWMGIVYHIIYFTTINKAAYIFGTGFIIQGLIFLWIGIYQKTLNFSFQKNFSGIIGLSSHCICPIDISIYRLFSWSYLSCIINIWVAMSNNYL